MSDLLQVQLDVSTDKMYPNSLRIWKDARRTLEDFLRELKFDGIWLMRPVNKTRWKSNDSGDIRVVRWDQARHGINIIVRVEGGGNGVWENLLIPPHGVNGEEAFDRMLLAVRKSAGLSGGVGRDEPKAPLIPPSVAAAVLAKPAANGNVRNGNGNGHIAAATPISIPPALPSPPPAPQPSVPPVAEVPTANRVRQQLDDLDRAAARERQRRDKLKELEDQRAKIRAEQQELQEKLAAVEQRLKALDDQEIGILEDSDRDTASKDAIEALQALERFFAGKAPVAA